MVASLLDRVIYSYADVDRLVGLRSGTAKRWLEGYSRTSRFYEPVLRDEPTGSDSVTWGEMVEARMLAEFRSRDVPVQRLRPAIRNVRAEALAEDYRSGSARSRTLVRSSSWKSSSDASSASSGRSLNLGRDHGR